MARVKITDLVNKNKDLEAKINRIKITLIGTVALVAILWFQVFFAS